jgi:hypothetical protein
LFFGFPGETYDTAMETMEFLEQTKPDFYRPLIWYCDPVTPIWEEKDKYGIKGYHFSWSHNTMDVSTACHLVERCFTSYDTPVWVPDPGFNFVSLFLQQNRGMSFDQIKTFLRSFNSVVKESLIDPSRVEPSPELIENLRRACQFDRPLAVDRERLELCSAEQYKRDEKFWFEELRSSEKGGSDQDQSHSLTAGDWRASESRTAPRPELTLLGEVCGVDRSSVLIAAFAAALWLTDHRSEKTIVAAVDGQEVFPISLKLAPASRFREIARTVQSKIEAGRLHRLFALRVIVNMLQMPAGVMSRPVFDGAYLESEGKAAIEQRFRFSATAYGGLDLLLHVNTGRPECGLQLMSSASRYSDHSMDRLAAALAGVLSEVAKNPEIHLEEIQLVESLHRPAGFFMSREEAPQFAF